MVFMKTTDHFLGDRVSVRYRHRQDSQWLGGVVIGRDVQRAASGERMRYVVQLDDNRRVVAFDDDVRRWTLSFEFFEQLERMAS
jgi:hypothetical protein